MRHWSRLIGLTTAMLILSINPLIADVPENLCPASKCEYLVRNHSGTYPDERERAAGHWQCYDEDTKASIACTFVRGDAIERFSDVYRRTGGQSSATAQWNFCLTSCPQSMLAHECNEMCCRRVGGRSVPQNPVRPCFLPGEE
jgi:hypothetical protein